MLSYVQSADSSPLFSTQKTDPMAVSALPVQTAGGETSARLSASLYEKMELVGGVGADKKDEMAAESFISGILVETTEMESCPINNVWQNPEGKKTAVTVFMPGMCNCSYLIIGHTHTHSVPNHYRLSFVCWDWGNMYSSVPTSAARYSCLSCCLPHTGRHIKKKSPTGCSTWNRGAVMWTGGEGDSELHICWVK